MTTKQSQRLELLEEKIRQLEMYHNTKCPPDKIKLVRRVIRRYEFLLMKMETR